MTLSSRLACVAVLAATVAHSAQAQARRVLPTSHPEAQLMGYYAAVMAFSPIGTPAPGIEVGGELSFIPSLSADERRVGFGGTKYEDTNRCPVLPRLRAAAASERVAVELGYIPPARVCGVKANLFGAAVSTQLRLTGAYRLMLRGNLLAGSLAAAITCSEDAVTNPANQVCFRGNPSDDRVRPFTVGADVALIHGGSHHRALDLYALVGVRRERVQFDVNFVNDSTFAPFSVFSDHERFETTHTRAHFAAGGSLRVMPRIRLSAELFYAPGALTTVRGRAMYTLRAPLGAP